MPDPDLNLDDYDEQSPLKSLDDQSGHEDIREAVRQFADDVAERNPVDQELLRSAALDDLRDLGVNAPAQLLNHALEQKSGGDPQPDRQGEYLDLDDPKPWPDPVDGNELLSEVADVFDRYLILPDGAEPVLALWTAHAHTHDASFVSPILVLTSPVHRCGKTRTLSILEHLVPRPLLTSHATPATIFRSIDATKPTLLIDEADTFATTREQLRGVLNSGHNRAGAFTLRAVGDDFEPRKFSTWAPKAIALIGRLPETLEDRSIAIRLRRKDPDETVETLRQNRLLKELRPVRRKLWRWSRSHLEAVDAQSPDVPDELHDRAADNWRPLLAIAEKVGGGWPKRGREAARTLSRTGDEREKDTKLMLLADLQEIFQERDRERLRSRSICSDLARREDRPWPEYKGTRSITPVQLARLLKPFGVKPKTIRFASGVKRGYYREDFREVFRRYLPVQKVQQAQHRDAKDSEDPSPTGPARVPTELVDNATSAEPVAAVAPSEGDAQPGSSCGSAGAEVVGG